MNTDNLGTVYIIHLHTPLGHARHYVGWSSQFAKRIWHHRNNTGSHFLYICNSLGIKWDVVVTFAGTRTDERRLKDTNNTSRYCPCCQAKPRKFQAHVLPHEQSYTFNSFERINP